MKLTGYHDFDWEPYGFRCGIPNDYVPYPTVDPTILTRPGTFATFGMNVVREMTIPCTFLFRQADAVNTTLQGAGYEAAFAYLYRRLNAVDPNPRQLRGLLNDGTAVWIPAVLQIPNRGSGEPTTKFINFVCVQPDWSALTPTAKTAVIS